MSKKLARRLLRLQAQRRRIAAWFLAALAFVACASWYVFEKPTLDERVLSGTAKIALDHGMKRSPDTPDSCNQQNYVRLTRIFQGTLKTDDEFKEVIRAIHKLCTNWEKGNINGDTMTYWNEDWGLMGEQSVTVRWLPSPYREISIEYSGQRRNWAYIVQGWLPESYRAKN